jgi:hypothetical protein
MGHNFEKFLQRKHAKDYQGTDDDMLDAFEDWLTQLDSNDLIQFAEEAIDEILNKNK